MGFHRMYVEVVSLGPSQFILEHHFKFLYLTEGDDTACPNAVFSVRTDRHRSQLGCNDVRVLVMYGHEKRTRLL